MMAAIHGCDGDTRGMRAAKHGCDRNTRDAGRAEGSHTRLLTGTKGAAKDGRDGGQEDVGPWG